MARLVRLLDVRSTLTRVLLLNASGVVYLLLVGRQEGHTTPGGLQWALAVGAFAAGLLWHRRPTANLTMQIVLFTVSLRVLDDPTISQVGTAWALAEFTAVRSVRRVATACGVIAVGYLVAVLPSTFDAITASAAGLGINLGLPVLIGTVVRTNRELGVQAARRVESEQRAARADERGAIARELHDVVAHHVASMVLRVGVARHVLPDVDPRAGEVFDDVHRTGTAALADLRRLVAVLRDPDGVRGDAAMTAIDPSALPATLDGAVETARRGGVIVEAEIDPAIAGLDAVRGLAVLRLTQEALTNVAKHAGESATARLRVSLAGGGDLDWEVVDDGGQNGPTHAIEGGHGLTGMRERIEVLGGVLEAGPTTGGGWRVATVLPGEIT
ncbi:histidine kinase [Actinoplanes sp. NBRC 101535]|uniref:sensor histidine kinase n=1 Tax=Actinoplanes sp. NBRC 101535 TaxID=3032196 RepID=UPI00255415A6|nr:histidine kinase [Actinoplanes sp. NBRC 101535]